MSSSLTERSLYLAYIIQSQTYQHLYTAKTEVWYSSQIATGIIPNSILVWFQWSFGMNIILQFLQHIAAGLPSSISMCTCIKSIVLPSYVELAQTVEIIKLSTLLLCSYLVSLIINKQVIVWNWHSTQVLVNTEVLFHYSSLKKIVIRMRL